MSIDGVSDMQMEIDLNRVVRHFRDHTILTDLAFDNTKGFPGRTVYIETFHSLPVIINGDLSNPYNVLSIVMLDEKTDEIACHTYLYADDCYLADPINNADWRDHCMPFMALLTSFRGKPREELRVHQSEFAFSFLGMSKLLFVMMAYLVSPLGPVKRSQKASILAI